MADRNVQTKFNLVSVNTPEWTRPFNKIAFINQGTVVFRVNEMPVPVGEQLVIELNVGEVNSSAFEIKFTPGGINACWLMYTYYDGYL